MPETLEQSNDLRGFVMDSFNTMDAELTNLAPGHDVWSAKVDEHQARFLGRALQEHVLFSFDLGRWEDGSKLECLTEVSPLVGRLQDYALLRGATLIAHVPAETQESKRNGYQSYLLIRFGATFLSSNIRRISRWLGANLSTGSVLNVKGDPMLTPGMLEGLPENTTLSDINYGHVPGALQTLTDQWNEFVKDETDRAQAESQRLFEVQAQEVYEAATGLRRDRALKRLRKQHELTVECELEMALVMVMPAKNG